jgi:hypothetical protein
MSEYAHTTTDKEEVDVPEWAEGYNVGDTIKWQHMNVEGVQENEIVGFSTRNGGMPVVVGDETPFEHSFVPETFAVDEVAHVSGNPVDISPSLTVDESEYVDVEGLV